VNIRRVLENPLGMCTSDRMNKLILKTVLIALVVCVGGLPVHTSGQTRLRIQSAGVRTHFPVIVKDALGRTFRFDAAPKRIISLTPGYTETLFALGLGDRVVGVDDYSDFPPEVASKIKVGSGHQVSIEQIVFLQPDLVVALVEEDKVDGLVAHGIPAIELFPDDLESVSRSILQLGEITDTKQRAQEIVDAMQRTIDQVQQRIRGLRRPRVFLELDGTDPARPFTPGPPSFIGDMIQVAGGWNIAHDIHTRSSQMSLETIVAADPEIIVLADAKNPINPQTKEDVLHRPGWSGITAVRAGAVIQVDNVFLFRPSPRIVEGVEVLARIFHPEAFK
jgi:iron complex transport system substrate-binding protein